MTKFLTTESTEDTETEPNLCG